MNLDRMNAALRGASDTHSLTIGAGVLSSVDAAFDQCFGAQSAVVVADETTFAIAGQAVDRHLRDAGRPVAEPIIFPATPMLYAAETNVQLLQAQLQSSAAIPVVVGSGTLNDITKLAAQRLKRDYLCVATAASMDGYTAFGAAITADGFKQTMACAAPRALLVDLDILAAAPAAMNATGYGDLLGKITAGADWLLADALDIEPIEPRAWALVQDSLREWVGQPQSLRAGEPQAIAALFEGLIMAGVAMQISQSSRPASGSEHRFSHLWEMQALGAGQAAVPHGFKVGIGTLAAAALYERVLARDFTDLDTDGLCRSWPSLAEVEASVLHSHAIPQLAASAVAESRAKYISAEHLRERLLLIQARWPTIREQLATQLMTANHIRELLQAAGCPTNPRAIGIDLATLRESYWLARTIRRRYTVLDLVYETGILDECVAELFAAGGFWNTVAPPLRVNEAASG